MDWVLLLGKTFAPVRISGLDSSGIQRNLIYLLRHMSIRKTEERKLANTAVKVFHSTRSLLILPILFSCTRGKNQIYNIRLSLFTLAIFILSFFTVASSECSGSTFPLNISWISSLKLHVQPFSQIRHAWQVSKPSMGYSVFSNKQSARLLRVLWHLHALTFK